MLAECTGLAGRRGAEEGDTPFSGEAFIPQQPCSWGVGRKSGKELKGDGVGLRLSVARRGDKIDHMRLSHRSVTDPSLSF